eukprot:6188790-Pleurochrysis_carterae.AAC.1
MHSGGAAAAICHTAFVITPGALAKWCVRRSGGGTERHPGGDVVILLIRAYSPYHQRFPVVAQRRILLLLQPLEADPHTGHGAPNLPLSLR